MRLRLLALAVVFLAFPGLGCAHAERREAFPIARNAFDTEAAGLANERGLTLTAEGEFKAAEQAFAKALRADAGYAAAHNNLGLVLLEQRRFYESAREFAMAIRLDPRAVEPLMNLGRLYETVGWGQDAAKQYENALDLRPEHPEAIARLAHVHRRLGVTREPLRSRLGQLTGELGSDTTLKSSALWECLSTE